MNFKTLAVKFVQDNHCACQTPVELIVKAMEIGAAEGVKLSVERIDKMRVEVAKKRKKLGISFS